jgi:hypothetical protein
MSSWILSRSKCRRSVRVFGIRRAKLLFEFVYPASSFHDALGGEGVLNPHGDAARRLEESKLGVEYAAPKDLQHSGIHVGRPRFQGFGDPERYGYRPRLGPESPRLGVGPEEDGPADQSCLAGP